MRGRLYFPNTIRYPADAGTLQRYQMRGLSADGVYQAWLDANPIIRIVSICGYNPQKLLPAPSFEREFMQSISEWAAAQMKLPYQEFAQSVFNTLTRDGEVTFSPTGRWGGPGVGFKPYPYQEAAMRQLGIDVERWNEANATPLDDLQRWLDMVRDSDPAYPVVIVGGDYTDLEMKVIRYMHATFVHESAGGSPTPRGRIEIFDYDDKLVIDIEGEGELPGLIDESFWLKQLKPKKPAVKQNGRSASYLDHDPTKRHKRRKKK